jgi:hypothetical protein
MFLFFHNPVKPFRIRAHFCEDELNAQVLKGGQNAPGHHKIIQGSDEPKGEKNDEKEGLNISSDLKRIEVKTGKAAKLDQGKHQCGCHQNKPENETVNVGQEVIELKNHQAQESQEIGEVVGNGVELCPKLGGHIELLGNESVGHIGHQVNHQEQGKKLFMARKDEIQNDREHQEPVKAQQIGNRQDFLLIHRPSFLLNEQNIREQLKAITNVRIFLPLRNSSLFSFE